MKRILLLSLLLMSLFIARAQQQAQYSQYMFNSLAFNPAYAGSHEALSINALHRMQWVGFGKGAPTSTTLAGHIPIRNRNIALGGLLERDVIGVHNDLSASAVYAYKIRLSTGTLSLGLSAGVKSQKNNFAQDQLPPVGAQGEDISYLQDASQWTLPQFGAGVYYYTPRFYAGLSVPNIMDNNFNSTLFNKETNDVRHAFLTSGVVIELNPDYKVQPSFLMKYVTGAPLIFDLNTNLIIKDVIWVGVSYRTLSAVSLIFQFQASSGLRIGYAHDISTTDLKLPTHEVNLTYVFKNPTDKIRSPRYF